MKTPREKPRLSTLLTWLLVGALVAVTIPLGVLTTPAAAQAATALNTGNPFTNGDLINQGGLWRLAVPGLQALMIWDSSDQNYVGSWDPTTPYISGNAPEVAGKNYPHMAYQWAVDGDSWGVSDFHLILNPAFPGQKAWESTMNGIDLGCNPMNQELHCIQHTHETTASDLPMWATINLISMDYDPATGIYTGRFYIMANPSNTNEGTEGSISQAAASKVPFIITWQNSGWLKIKKSSGAPSITDNNACYRLAGAQFGIYGTMSDAKADTGRLDTLTTDASGTTPVSGNLVPGTCYIRELVAPQGYQLDDTITAVAIDAGQTLTYDAVDRPDGDTARGYVYKVDAETGAQQPQGAGSLAGAQFTIAYYDGYYNSAAAAAASGSPTRSWIQQTDARGMFSVGDAGSLVSGDALYRDSSGKTILPLGTYVTRETKASPGYLLPDKPTVFVTRVVADASSPGGTRLEGDSFGSAAQPGNAATVQREQVIRGDLEIAKICDASSEPVETGLAGIRFSLREQTSGKTYAITTNDAGFATTRALLPAGSDLVGALPYGTYLVHEEETSVPAGLHGVPDFTVKISKDKQLSQYILNDAQSKAAIKIVKTDATTGKTIAASAMTFQILDESGQVVSFTRHSPEVETVTQFTTNAHGVFTLPERLGWGTYYIHELEAPTGYLKSPDLIFSVTGDASFDAPLVIEFADQPQMARIAATKLDLQSQAPLTGAVYGVFATEDITTADGTLRAAQGDMVDIISIEGTTAPVPSGPLFCGDYELRELVAPEGYLLDTDSHPVKLTSDSAVTTVTAQTIVQDDYTKLRISKTDLVSGQELDGAQLMLSDASGSIVATWTTDAAPHEIDRLSPGDYQLRETAAPEGYLVSEEVTFTVQATGKIQKVVMKDDYTKLDISKQDATTGKELPGATLVVKDPAGEVIDQWVSTDTVHRIEHLSPGIYTLTETSAPEGYQIAQTVNFTVMATGEIQPVTMKDARIVAAPLPLPQTGDRLRVSGILIAMLIACSGAGMLAATQTQRRKEGLQ